MVQRAKKELQRGLNLRRAAMGWVTMSLRKMALKQRINNYQYRLIQISQENQTLANQSQYTQRYLNAMKNQQYGTITSNYTDAVKNLQQTASNLDPTSKDWTAYQNALDQASLAQSRQQMSADSIFQGYEDALMADVQRRQDQLDAEQEQIETQLQAAQAEYKSMDEAMQQSIEDSAIKLT